MIETIYIIHCERCAREQSSRNLIKVKSGMTMIRTFWKQLEKIGWRRVSIPGEAVQDCCPFCVRPMSALRPRKVRKVRAAQEK